MFTLVIPYHNRARFLPRTLQSLLESTVLPRCIIFVDNASSDGSAEICRGFACEHPELNVLLLTEKRKGACAARNKGLEQVTTEWVCFFDSDDELSPDYFSAVLSQIEQCPSAQMIASRTTRVYPDGKERPREVQYSSSVTDQILSGQLATQGMCFKTDFLRRIGGWNEELPRWNDWELGVRALVASPSVCWIRNKAFHRVYEHADSITGNDYSSSAKDLLHAIAVVRREVEHNESWLEALGCRALVLSGYFRCERHAEEEARAISLARSIFHELGSRKFSFIFHLLSVYVRTVNRGSWYVALKLCHLLSFSDRISGQSKK